MSMPEPESCTLGDDEVVRLCDFCNVAKALLYCRADSAKLCLSCDREVHSTNQLFKKHSRVLLCDYCSSSPSTIFCCTESAVLCQNCDWESHRDFRAVHDRRPIEGFNGCPSVGELLNFLGLEDLGKNNPVFEGGRDESFLDMVVWETPSVVSIDDLIVSNESLDCGRNFQAMGVPPLPKNRNSICGKHKQELLSQLREMAKMEPNFSGCLEDLDLVGFQSESPGKCHWRDSSLCPENDCKPIPIPSFEADEVKWSDITCGVPDEGLPSTFVENFIKTNHLVPDKDSDIGDGIGIASGYPEVQTGVPMDSKMLQVTPLAGARELNAQERDYAISRYKEKKKTRRYEKHIRYESRKLRAESRTRIKGRFAKMDR